MPEQIAIETVKTPHAPWFSTPGSIVLGALALAAIAAALGLCAAVLQTQVTFVDAQMQALAVAGTITVAALFAFFAIVMLIVGTVRWGVYGRGAVGVPERLNLHELADLLRAMNQRLLLSETAKRIAYRQQDLQALRRAIERDIDGGDFDAGMVLVTELAQSYGYREEAEGYRERISAARMAEQEAKISEAVARLDDILARHDFDRAIKEAAKIQRLFPDSDRVRNLSRQVLTSREKYKHELEREFLGAAERDDVDRAMEVLKTLDKYLSEGEAAPLRETARGVIGKKRDNLGVQFKMAVHDKEWLNAVQVGEQIIREFPNTRMSEEVRSMIDLLRERAGSQQAARSHAPA